MYAYPFPLISGKSDHCGCSTTSVETGSERASLKVIKQASGTAT